MSSGRSEEEASANPNVEYIHLSLRPRPGDSIIWVSLAGELDPESRGASRSNQRVNGDPLGQS